jgi:transmembrane sensor
MTTMKENPSAERIEEEASLWAARIEGGALNDRDRAELSAWLAANPEHRRVLGCYCELSAKLDAQLNRGGGLVRSSCDEAEDGNQDGGRCAVSATLPSGGDSAPPSNNTTASRRWRATAGALLAAAAVVVFVVVLAGRPREIATRTAERQTIALDDGSRVELNARTSLAVDLRRGERRVRLVRGEAWFAVAKDPMRPFVVETPAGVVRVTGTEFDVRAAKGERVEVTVLSGTVRVRASGGAAADEAVTPGRQAVMSGGQVEVRALSEGATQDAVAWRKGQTVFDNTPLGEAIERFAAYHARTIIVDPAAADLRLGGRFSLDDLDGLLESVGSVLPVQVLRGPDGEVRIAPVRKPGR